MLREEAKKTVKLSLPIILGELAQMSLHLIDSAMVGAVGYKHLAAAALVLSVVNIPFVFGIGLTISVSQMVSLAHGKQDENLISHYFYNGFWLCAVFAVAISLALGFGGNVLFHLGQDAEVVQLALPFMRLISISLIPMLLFLALKHFADGLQQTRTAMILSVAAVPLNVFLNWLLIYGNLGFPRLELVGAGWATLLTRVSIFAILAWIILFHPKFNEYTKIRGEQWKLRGKTLKELLYIGIPSALQLGLEVGAFAVSAIIIGTIDAVSLAAHQIAITLAAMTFMVSAGLSQGASIRTSNALGRGDWRAISEIGKSTLLISFAFGSLCAVGFVAFRRRLPSIFNEDSSVVALAASLLLFAAIFQISDSLQAIGAGLLRGIKDVRVPTVLITVAYWIVGIPAGYILAFYFDFKAVGIWLGFIAGLTFSAVVLCARFLRMAKMKIVKN